MYLTILLIVVLVCIILALFGYCEALRTLLNSANLHTINISKCLDETNIKLYDCMRELQSVKTELITTKAKLSKPNFAFADKTDDLPTQVSHIQDEVLLNNPSFNEALKHNTGIHSELVNLPNDELLTLYTNNESLIEIKSIIGDSYDGVVKVDREFVIDCDKHQAIEFDKALRKIANEDYDLATKERHDKIHTSFNQFNNFDGVDSNEAPNGYFAVSSRAFKAIGKCNACKADLCINKVTDLSDLNFQWCIANPCTQIPTVDSLQGNDMPARKDKRDVIFLVKDF